jgi:carbon monoxide dehydrogenase subunit G
MIDDTHSVWTLKVEITFATRLIEAQATITRSDPPNQLDFTLVGLNEKVNGEGSLRLQPVDDNETRVEFRFRLEASGIAAALTNVLIARVLPKLTASFEDCLRRSLEGN